MARPNQDAKYLALLQDNYARNGVLPSLSGICDVVGFGAKNSAVRLVDRLKKAGFLRSASNGRLVPERPFFARQVLSSPIRAGKPDALQDATAHDFMLDSWLVPHPSKTLVVPVGGMSMKGVGIFDRDMLIVERELEAVDGDFVAALVDGEVTVKELCRSGDEWELRAHNEDFESIWPAHELEILGVVTGVVRRYARRENGKRQRRKGVTV